MITLVLVCFNRGEKNTSQSWIETCSLNYQVWLQYKAMFTLCRPKHRARAWFSLGCDVNTSLLFCKHSHQNSGTVPVPRYMDSTRLCLDTLYSGFKWYTILFCAGAQATVFNHTSVNTAFISIYIITKSMHALWLVNQLWVIVPVNPRKNCASSELLYKSNTVYHKFVWVVGW